METELSILLVEDNPVDALVVTRLLHAASPSAVRIHEVGSLAEATACYDARHHDVVLVDLSLPDASGLLAVRAMLDCDPDAAVVVLTATADEKLGEEAVRLGAQDYVTKGGLTGAALRRVVRYARGRKAARRESEERYRRVIEGALDAVVIADVSGIIVDWNARAERLFGWTRAEAIGSRLADTILRCTTFDGFDGSSDESPSPNTVRETDACRKDGTTVPVEVAVSVIGTNGTRLYSAFIRDVTERRQALSERRSMEAQLVHAQKLESIGRLAGGVAHDFNNVLAAVMSFSELLLMDSAPDDPRRPDVETILEAATGAAGLTRQLLAFSRRQVFNPKTTDLNGLIAGLDRMLRRLIGEDIEVVTLFGEQLGLVAVDQGQLESAIVNLVVNARDAMPAGGTLTVETTNVELAGARRSTSAPELCGPAVRITVTDTGVGMSAEVLEHMFEPFFTTKEPGKGTGLGLASVYGIVKQCGGTVSVTSAPGKGTQFVIDLPRVRPAETAGTGPALDEAPGGTETILLAEDNALVRRGLAATLRARGYTIIAAANGDEAVRLAAQHGGPIHLLLSDVVMPCMSAQELGERFSALRPAVPIIYMSGYMSESIQGRSLNVAEYVQKPFTSEALARKVRAALDAPAA